MDDNERLKWIAVLALRQEGILRKEHPPIWLAADLAQDIRFMATKSSGFLEGNLETFRSDLVRDY